MKTGRYCVSDLLASTDIDQIIIPELQRDYVWGEKNVNGLLSSILNNFKDKTSMTLEIKDNGNIVNENIGDFLTKEYSKLRFNTRVGFIYAYHNNEYAGKYFLIDGQQRMTTIYLLLLVAYVKAGKSDVFKKKYFANFLPKIDYKVRETAHDFMVDFIKHELDSTHSCGFEGSENFYEAYKLDVTSKSLLNNYNFIKKTLCGKSINMDELIDYVENYIEFNYFDTNISEQGERLYIYMNSRGEGLSVQERLRPLIVSREKDKLLVGEKWETWQDFFWQNKGENPNADKGFQEFCKWATILHMICFDDTKLKNSSIDGKKGRFDIIRDYIKLDSKILSEQGIWIREYQDVNSDFDFKWLDSMFNAVKRLAECAISNNLCLPETWLWNIQSMKDYIMILPCICYLMKWSNATDREITRSAMFFKNAMVYEETIYHDADGTAISCVKLIKDMYTNGISDFRLLPHGIDSKLFNNKVDEMKFACYNGYNDDKWEDVFWEIIRDEDFNKFLKGNVAFLLKWKYLFGNINPVDFKIRKERLKKMVFENDQYESQELLLKLLKYGDFYLDDNGGSYVGGPWLHRYKFIVDNSSRREDNWYNALNDERLSEIVINYLNGSTPLTDSWFYDLFVSGDDNVFDYMGNNRFLCDDYGNRVILLAQKQARKDNSVELMVKWLNKRIEKSKIDDFCTLGLNFEYSPTSNQIIKHRSISEFSLKLEYKWINNDSFWNVKLVCGNSLANPPAFVKNHIDWTMSNGECTYGHNFKDDWNKTIEVRIRDIIGAVNNLFNCDVL